MSDAPAVTDAAVTDATAMGAIATGAASAEPGTQVAERGEAGLAKAPAGLKLRVLTGPLEGADAPLPGGEAVTVGRGFRNDVVLRDKSVGDARVSIEAHDRTATLRVLSGEIVLLGRRMRAPEEAVLPHYLPLAIGASALAVGSLAVGSDEAARWTACEGLVPHLTNAPANDVPPAPRGRIAWSKDIAVGACAFGALAACTAFLAPGQAEAPPAAPPMEIVRVALASGGYGEVLASARDEGERVRIQGFVATDDRKRALRETLDDLGVAYAGEVRSGEAAARQVQDLFAANGLPVAAAYAGGGAVRVTGVKADPDTAERVRASALSDVPYLSRIEMEVQAPAPTAPSRAFTAEIVEAVGGEFGYVITRDGGRYFAGGTTPQGGKITGIADGAITIEDGGEPMTYTF